jgi:hypothetical protein
MVRSRRVSSLESLSLIITRDSLLLFRKVYFKPEGRGLSTMGVLAALEFHPKEKDLMVLLHLGCSPGRLL